MGIFKILESNINKSLSNFSEFLADVKGDTLKGAEFVFYSLASIFKDTAISELEVGIVDSSYREEKYDFGIDAIYITASNDFIEQPEEVENYNEDTKFKIHIFQFKRGTGITQADLLKFHKGIQKCLIEESISDLDNLYFHNRMIVLNEIKEKLFTSYPNENIEVRCNIVFGGLESNITSQSILNEEIVNIKKTLEENGYTNSKVIISDCQALINAYTKVQEVIDVIEYQKTFKYITDSDSNTKLNGYISIINGRDIAELVRRHQSSIFEANIRDYFKRSDLNSKIIETSSSEQESKFFWSYNNGLTMTCSKVDEMPNNKYKLHNIQIVNGCQTSNAIYLALKNRERVEELKLKGSETVLTNAETIELIEKDSLQFNDSTSVLVKIIETKNDDFIYRITETTNSQTPIKAFSLRANDDIQKLIEKYFEENDVNYERRINFLRNKGKKNIYSIQKLFQLYTSQILFKPSQVKTQPKNMFISTYDDVFPAPHVKNVNYVLYLIPVLVDIALNKGVREYIKENPNLDSFKKTLISYGNYHLGCFILSSILRSDYNEKGIVNKEKQIIKQLNDHFTKHLIDAIASFEKIIKNQVGTRKEIIPSAVRKAELDAKIVRFIKSRK